MTQRKSTENIRHVYIAAPFFSGEEIAVIEQAESILNKKGISFFSPMRHGSDKTRGTTEWAYQLFETDKSEIEKADAVLALYYGSNGDTGTAWECGYAAAVGVPVILVHVNEDGDSNLMMHCGCTTNIYLKDLANFDFKAMPLLEFHGKMY